VTTGVSPAAHAQLAAKSNYVNILTGHGSTLLGLSSHTIMSATGSSSARVVSPAPTENRRTSHKAAEQRRRDSLKQCFEELRLILPPIPPDEDDDFKRPGEGNVGGQRNGEVDPVQPNKGISKVALLRKSNEYLLHLHVRLARRDGIIELLRERVRELGARLGEDELVGGIEGVDYGPIDPEDEEPFGPVVLPLEPDGSLGEEGPGGGGGEDEDGGGTNEACGEPASEPDPSRITRRRSTASASARRRSSSGRRATSSAASGYGDEGDDMAVDADGDRDG
jgi:hypothetical protein